MEHYAFVLIVNEKYWNQIRRASNQNFSTHAFVRKNKVGPKQTQKLLFYVTKKKQVLGSADFIERQSGNGEELWKKFGNETCFESFDEYKKFADQRETMTFIRFSNFTELTSPLSKEGIGEVLGSMQGFGAGKYVDKDTATKLV